MSWRVSFSIIALMLSMVVAQAQDLNSPFKNGEPQTTDEKRAWTIRLAKETDCHTFLSWQFSGGTKSKSAFLMAFLAYKYTYGARPNNRARYVDISLDFCQENPYVSIAQFNQYYWENWGWQEARETTPPTLTEPPVPRDIPHVRPPQFTSCRHPAARVGDPPFAGCPR